MSGNGKTLNTHLYSALLPSRKMISRVLRVACEPFSWSQQAKRKLCVLIFFEPCRQFFLFNLNVHRMSSKRKEVEVENGNGDKHGSSKRIKREEEVTALKVESSNEPVVKTEPEVIGEENKSLLKEEKDVFEVLKEESDESDDEAWPEESWETIARHHAKITTDVTCPYLDTIDRKLLDFDFEKLCSISLSHLNVYACLVCGKYYQGRGKNSHAYFHALEADHHVFINLRTEDIYCLPDNYEVQDPSLEDIMYNLRPVFTPKQIRWLRNNKTFVHALDGTDYLPGVVGLNNIKNTDWLSVIVQALQYVKPLREFFLLEKNFHDLDLLSKTFGELTSKLWNPKRFKGHVSPHELLQSVSSTSNKQFKIGDIVDPHQFLAWFLHTLHQQLGGGKKKDSTIVNQCFQGELQVVEEKALKKQNADEHQRYGRPITSTKKFLYISLNLPPAPLFKDDADRSLIPQVPLFDLLAKFDGVTEEFLPDGSKRRYSFKRLPRYLIVHYKRFHSNNWFKEKNPTLVNFPIRNLDLKQYKARPEPPTVEELEKLSVAELKKRLKKKKIECDGIVEKAELAERLAEYYEHLQVPSKYDLVANICHEGKPDKGAYRVHVFHQPSQRWYELQDLHVWSSETMPQLVALSESYIQIYQLSAAHAGGGDNDVAMTGAAGGEGEVA
eukprot:g15362.t1